MPLWKKLLIVALILWLLAMIPGALGDLVSGAVAFGKELKHAIPIFFRHASH